MLSISLGETEIGHGAAVAGDLDDIGLGGIQKLAEAILRLGGGHCHHFAPRRARARIIAAIAVFAQTAVGFRVGAELRLSLFHLISPVLPFSLFKLFHRCLRGEPQLEFCPGRGSARRPAEEKPLPDSLPSSKDFRRKCTGVRENRGILSFGALKWNRI